MNPSVPAARLFSSLLFGAVFAAAALLFSGCETMAKKSDEAVSWVRGEAQAVVDMPLDKAIAAARAAGRDLKYPLVQESTDSVLGILEFRNAANRSVQVRLEKVNDQSTLLRVRVGAFGDQAIEKMVIDRIRANAPKGSWF